MALNGGPSGGGPTGLRGSDWGGGALGGVPSYDQGFTSGVNNLSGSGPSGGNPFGRANAQIQSDVYRNQTNANFGRRIAGNTDYVRNNLSNNQARDNYGFDAQSRALDEQSLRNNFSNNQASLGLDLNNVGFDKERNGLRLQGNNLDRGQIGEQRGFAQRDLDQSLIGSMAQGVREIRGNNSNATAGGSWFSPMRGVRNNDTLFDTKLAGDKARLGYDQTISGLNNKTGHLDLDDKALDISNRELDNQAAKIGLSQQQLRTTLDEGLAKLGLNGQISTNQLMYQIANGDLGNVDIVNRVMALATQDTANGVGNQFIQDGRAGSMLSNSAPYRYGQWG